jgi:hypothetical protein
VRGTALRGRPARPSRGVASSRAPGQPAGQPTSPTQPSPHPAPPPPPGPHLSSCAACRSAICRRTSASTAVGSAADSAPSTRMRLEILTFGLGASSSPCLRRAGAGRGAEGGFVGQAAGKVQRGAGARGQGLRDWRGRPSAFRRQPQRAGPLKLRTPPPKSPPDELLLLLLSRLPPLRAELFQLLLRQPQRLRRRRGRLCGAPRQGVVWVGEGVRGLGGWGARRWGAAGRGSKAHDMRAQASKVWGAPGPRCALARNPRPSPKPPEGGGPPTRGRLDGDRVLHVDRYLIRPDAARRAAAAAVCVDAAAVWRGGAGREQGGGARPGGRRRWWRGCWYEWLGAAAAARAKGRPLSLEPRAALPKCAAAAAENPHPPPAGPRTRAAALVAAAD